MPRRAKLLALALGLATTSGLGIGHTAVGYVRDEGSYFEAARSYASWTSLLVQSPVRALSERARNEHFSPNHEHPALMKLAFGMSGRVFTRAPDDAELPSEHANAGMVPLFVEGAAMRLPAQILAGVGVATLFSLGHAMGGVLAGILCAGWFILLPHVWFHAGLACFDVPVAVATLLAAIAYRKSLGNRGWAIALGPIIGIAASIKHNAAFLPLVFAVHYTGCLVWSRARGGQRIRLGQMFPAPFVSMLVLALPTFVLLWPWLWSDPAGRLWQYLQFHREHAYYNIEYLGRNYNLPPLPISYPWVMTFATVPIALLVLALAGLVLRMRDDLREHVNGTHAGTFWAPLPNNAAKLDGLLWSLLAMFPIVLISLPWIPIFGGTKHWLTAYPFFAIAAAHAFRRITQCLALTGWLRFAPAAAVALLLTPSAMATRDSHPYGMSQYGPLLGGPRGGTRLGLVRGFWGHAVLPLLDTLVEHSQPPRPIYLHDMHELAHKQYVREGRWPQDTPPVPLQRARAALMFHELHMTTYEVDVWNELGTTAPVAVLELDDVPLTSLYLVGHANARAPE